MRFNPRARVGRDTQIPGFATPLTTFQSTRPRGARRKLIEERDRARQFQSTRPRGARRHLSHTVSHYQVFQSTRPRGARPSAIRGNLIKERVSIHAPAWGATPHNNAREG